MKNETKRKECPLRHESGHCLSIGGSCTAVRSEICAAMQKAYEHGKRVGGVDGVSILEISKEQRLKTPEKTMPNGFNTKISYLYRDGDNYKTRFEEVVNGEFTVEQIEKIRKCLFDGEYFIPEQVGLTFWRNYEFDPEIDGDFCEFDSLPFVLTTAQPTLMVTADELVNRFISAAKANWNQGGAGNV